jgi:hypothetical protein
MTDKNNLGLFEGLIDNNLGDLSDEVDNKTIDTNEKQKSQEKKKDINKETIPVDKTRIVCYAGHKIYIEDRTLSLENVRKKLEKDFPELSKNRTEMVYDDKTGIVVPVIKAKKNGGVF